MCGSDAASVGVLVEMTHPEVHPALTALEGGAKIGGFRASVLRMATGSVKRQAVLVICGLPATFGQAFEAALAGCHAVGNGMNQQRRLGGEISTLRPPAPEIRSP